MEPQTPVPPVTPVELPKPKKNNLAVILLSILLVITLLISGYLFLQVQNLTKQLAQYQSATPSPSPTATADETASQAPTGDLTNWKTYTGTYFSFKHPRDWKIDDTTMGTSLVISNPNKKYPDGTLTFSAVQGQNSCDSDMNSAKNWNWQNLQEKSTTVGGMKGTELSGKTDYTNGIYYDRKFILIKGQNSCYTFDYWSYDGSQTNTLDQILSTFRFTE